ncbi:MAG: OsmC family peroxiredoxin, partial [Pseudomonadota bacterium]
TTVKLRANAECPSHSLSHVAIRDLKVAIDEPTERGGTNLGPTPTDTALAALIGCTNVIGHKCAASLGIETGHLTISAVCEFEIAAV